MLTEFSFKYKTFFLYSKYLVEKLIKSKIYILYQTTRFKVPKYLKGHRWNLMLSEKEQFSMKC